MNPKREPTITQTLKTIEANRRVQMEIANTMSTKQQQMELK